MNLTIITQCPSLVRCEHSRGGCTGHVRQITAPPGTVFRVTDSTLHPLVLHEITQ